ISLLTIPLLPSSTLFPYTTLFRSPRLAGLFQQDADVGVALRQVALEPGEGGVGVGQPLPDRPRRLERRQRLAWLAGLPQQDADRSEEHTSELQSLTNLVCRLLLEK